MTTRDLYCDDNRRGPERRGGGKEREGDGGSSAVVNSPIFKGFGYLWPKQSYVLYVIHVAIHTHTHMSEFTTKCIQYLKVTC